jgi:ER membrane protein complex subunit 1
MTFTTTANGISVKDLVGKILPQLVCSMLNDYYATVATTNGQIQTFPRRLLDPRRPYTKPSSSEIEEEWLIQYEPVLPDDPRQIISHMYKLLPSSNSIRSIYTFPTSLESTSLVFGYGLDLIFTRVSPSGRFDLLSEGFNKAQLVFTCLGLGAAIMVTRPMMKRKKLREKWYSNST